MTDLIERAKKWLLGKHEQENAAGSTRMLKNLMEAVEQTQDVEYDCAEVYDLLDQYVEMVNSKEDATQLMPLVRHHLDMCPDCLEEYDALMHVLENQPAAG